MKDFKNDSTATLSRFGRDRRPRTTSQTAQHVEHRPQKRASYNPNFTEDNRPVGESRPNRNSTYGSSRQYGDPHGTPKHGSHDRYGNDRQRSFGDDRYGSGQRKYSQNRHAGKPSPRRYYDENGDIDGNRIDADDPAYDFAPSRQYRSDSRSSYGNKPRTAKPYGKQAAGRNQHSDRQEYADRSGRPDRNGSNGNRNGKSGKPAGRGQQRRNDERPKAYPKYSPDRNPGELRLNRFIAQSGVCSRREADDFITAGLVTVNGEVVTTLGSKVRPEDDVRFNGERIQGEHKVYLVLNKPKGYVTSLDDPHADKTVMELVKGACAERIYPVGRLDKNSVGLLLFTNDGDITRRLTHPSLNKKKVYQVSLDKPLTNADMQAIADGIMLEDGEIHADEIACVKDDRKEVGIEIHSGRNRVVRRIFEHLGYKVQKLDRVYYAGLTKKNLKRGAWRFLTDAEVAHLKSGQYE